MTATGDVSLVNSGTMPGEGNPPWAAMNILGSFVTVAVTNAGLMSSSAGTGLVASADARVVRTNTGTIAGRLTSITLGVQEDEVRYTGMLIGDVVWGGDDVHRTDDALVLIVEGRDAGTDRVEAVVDFDLGQVANVEDLTLLGGARLGAGNGLNNRLTGNQQDNRLTGVPGRIR